MFATLCKSVAIFACLYYFDVLSFVDKREIEIGVSLTYLIEIRRCLCDAHHIRMQSALQRLIGVHTSCIIV